MSSSSEMSSLRRFANGKKSDWEKCSDSNDPGLRVEKGNRNESEVRGSGCSLWIYTHPQQTANGRTGWRSRCNRSSGDRLFPEADISRRGPRIADFRRRKKPRDTQSVARLSKYSNLLTSIRNFEHLFKSALKFFKRKAFIRYRNTRFN